MKITVYSKTDCRQCKILHRFLSEREVQYHEINIDLDSEALTYVKEVLGASSAPITVIEKEGGQEVIFGFAPSELKQALHFYNKHFMKNS